MPRVNLTPLDDGQRTRAAGSYAYALELVRELREHRKHLNLEFDHAVSAALYGLVLAARSYRPALGLWPTHAARWIKGEVSDEAARWRRRGLTCRNGGKGGPAPECPDVGPLDED